MFAVQILARPNRRAGFDFVIGMQQRPCPVKAESLDKVAAGQQQHPLIVSAVDIIRVDFQGFVIVVLGLLEVALVMIEAGDVVMTD